ncbi:hypothetical protein ATL51_0228 [Pseudonocardia alni]|uniref:Uncharacterized protein n=1 Tax=Pseudonocardia alni TaxID=33907 RepID=A0AA44UVE9_PSEA5|nr:hypothetical protein ATL51_0228 [Pseudonocardia alni]
MQPRWEQHPHPQAVPPTEWVTAPIPISNPWPQGPPLTPSWASPPAALSPERPKDFPGYGRQLPDTPRAGSVVRPVLFSVFASGVFAFYMIMSVGDLIASLINTAVLSLVALGIYRVFIKRPVYRSQSEAEQAQQRSAVRDAAILNAMRVERSRHFHPNGLPKKP